MKAVWYVTAGLWVGLALDYFISGKQAPSWLVGLFCLWFVWDSIDRARHA